MPPPRKTLVTLLEWFTGRTLDPVAVVPVFIMEIMVFLLVGTIIAYLSRLAIPDIEQRSLLRGGRNLLFLIGWSLMYGLAQNRRRSGLPHGPRGDAS
jgi:NhaP-type Na+/H+ or K+/H+ antiporter